MEQFPLKYVRENPDVTLAEGPTVLADRRIWRVAPGLTVRDFDLAVGL